MLTDWSETTGDADPGSIDHPLGPNTPARESHAASQSDIELRLTQ
jgi:hypothetical protein